MDCVIGEAGGLEISRTKALRARGKSQEAALLYGFCFHSRPQAPAFSSCLNFPPCNSNKSFPDQIAFVPVFTRATEKPLWCIPSKILEAREHPPFASLSHSTIYCLSLDLRTFT